MSLLALLPKASLKDLFLRTDEDPPIGSRTKERIVGCRFLPAFERLSTPKAWSFMFKVKEFSESES